MLIVRIVGTRPQKPRVSLVSREGGEGGGRNGREQERTHHEALDVLDARLLDALAHEQHAHAGPHKQEHAERGGDEPVERREPEGAPEDDVQRRRVDDEHPEARAADDPREVVVVAYDRLAEREAEFGLDREDLSRRRRVRLGQKERLAGYLR